MKFISTLLCVKALLCTLFLFSTSLFAQDLQERLLCGMSVVTCYTDPVVGGGPVAAIFDVRPNASAPMGADWNNPALGVGKVGDIHPPDWDINIIGQVFGIAIDYTNGDIFLAATDVYRLDSPWLSNATGPAGTGGVYKTLGSDLTNTTTFISTAGIPSSPCSLIGNNAIPNTGGTGNSLGNIAYDKYNQQLFITNTEDGRIYRVDMAGNILSIYDPFSTASDFAGMVTPTERIWGVGVFDAGTGVRVYFGRERSSPTNDSEIWSVPLLPSGEFAGVANSTCIIQGPEVLEITVPAGGQEKVTDIAFSTSCRMLIAERGNPHDAHVYEYNLIGTDWAFANEIFVGSQITPTQNSNAAGGIDYGYKQINQDPLAGCDSIIWASGNYMMTTSGNLVYGIEGVKKRCNPQPANEGTDLYIDFDQVYNTSQKTEIGDVEVFRCTDCEKLPDNCEQLLMVMEEQLATPQGDACCYTFDLKNNMGPQITKVEVELLSPNWIFSSQAVDTGDGFYIDGVPTATKMCVRNTGGPIPAGNSLDAIQLCLDTIVADYSGSQTIVFRWYQEVSPDCEVVMCTDTITTHCLPDPTDDCAEINVLSIECNQENPYEYFVNFTVTNNYTSPISFVTLQDLTATYGFSSCASSSFLPSLLVSVGGLLAPGNTSGPICAKIVSSTPILSPTEVCFRVGLVDEDLGFCCHATEKVCVTLEPCCDPCEDKDIRVEDIELANNQSGCCKKLDIINNCPYDIFTKLEAEILTPGVTFGYHALGGPDAGDWITFPGSSDTKVCFGPQIGTVPTGTTDDIFQFCLDDIDDASEIPQKVVLRWYAAGTNKDTLLCTDTLMFNCDVNYECLEVTEQSITCNEENQKYDFTFTVTNTSAIAFSAEDVLVKIESPAGPVFQNSGLNVDIFTFPSPINPGESATITTCINVSPFPSPAAYIVLKYRLAGLVGNQDTCCYENVLDTLLLPDCGDPCPPDDITIGGNLSITNAYHTAGSIFSTAVITPTGDITYQAGHEITLQTGFHAQANSDFLAYIDPCDTIECCPDDPLMELEWLADIAMQNVQIAQYKLNGECVYAVTRPCGENVSDAITTLYDCEGNVICQTGGIAGLTCDEFALLTDCILLQGCKNITCDELDFSYTGTALTYTFEVSGLPIGGVSPGTWSVTGGPYMLPISIGLGTMTTFTFPAPGVYEICFIYTQPDGTLLRCCKTIVIQNSPFDCDKIEYTFDAASNSYELTLPGVADADISNWKDESNNIIGNTATISVSVGNECGIRKFTVTFFNPATGTYETCSIAIYICDPYLCDALMKNYNPTTGQWTIKLPGIAAADISYWENASTGTVIAMNSQQVIIPNPPVGTCVNICVSYYDPSCDCYRLCCVRICNINNCRITPSDGPCAAVYDPVCGCDGVTYGNSCQALAAGIQSWTAGECCDDLVVNGDFEQGNTGFTSALSLSCACVGSSYCIGQLANPDKCNNSFWQAIASPTNDNYMIIDAGNSPSQVWSQSVSVTSGETYTFSFDLYPDISNSGGPTLSLVVNGTIIASGITGAAGSWTTASDSWTATSSGSVTIAILQTATSGFGDYGIDNIKFTNCPANGGTPFTTDKPTVARYNSEQPSLTNYPNPFSGSTIIALSLPQTQDGSLVVFDVNGKVVFQQNGNFELGMTQIEFQANDLPDGVYFYRYQSTTDVLSKSMVLIRNK